MSKGSNFCGNSKPRQRIFFAGEGVIRRYEKKPGTLSRVGLKMGRCALFRLGEVVVGQQLALVFAGQRLQEGYHPVDLLLR